MDIDTQQTPYEQITALIQSLPRLDKDSVPKDDACPICLLPFPQAFDHTSPLEQDNVAELTGVTKIIECGHLFCRRDLVEWIKGMHGTCPTCRYPFLHIQTPSDSDDGSSDGGEYVPDFESDGGFTDMDEWNDEDIEREMMELDTDDPIYYAYLRRETDHQETFYGQDMRELGFADDEGIIAGESSDEDVQQASRATSVVLNLQAASEEFDASFENSSEGEEPK